MRVVVTSDDIRNGKRKDPHSCPIALAVKRNSPKKYVAVTSHHVCDGFAVYGLPTAAMLFIKMFDEGYEVRPITFEVSELP